MNLTRSFALIFVITAFAVIVRSQDPPPPPAPLIYAPPAASDLSNFNSGGDGFEAVFAGNPKKKTVREGRVFRETFTSVNKGLTTVVSVYRLADPDERWGNADLFFEGTRAELLKPEGTSLISEKPVEFSGFDAKDFDVAGRLDYTKTRILVSGERIFEIALNVPNWPYLGEAKRKEFFAETERFFASFKVNSGFDHSLIVGEVTPESIDRRRGIEELASWIGDEDDRGWREYRFDSIGAAVSFPEEPKKETEPYTDGVITATLNSYSVKENSQAYVFAEANLGLTSASDEFIGGLYEGWQKGVVQAFPGSKVEQKFIEFAGSRASRISAENDLVKFEAIGVFIGGRLYQLMAIVPKAEAKPEDKEENKLLAAKFFDSFRIVPVKDPVEINRPSDAVRVITEEKFVNEELQFTISLPEGWNDLGTTGDPDAVKRWRENDPGVSKTAKDQLERSFSRTRLLFQAVKPNSPVGKRASFIGGIEMVTINELDVKTIAQASEENFINNLGYKPYKPFKVININGTIFYRIWLRKHFNTVEIKQIVYMKRANGKLLQFAITYSDDADLEVMERSLNTLEFGPIKK
ncbi:MAG: hypothetical protein R2681_17175 [Pyrinomonadaceae bacterium]